MTAAPTPQAISALLRQAGITDRSGALSSCYPWSATSVIVTWDLVAGIRPEVSEAAERTLQRAGYRTTRGWNANEGTRLIVTAPADPEGGADHG